MNKIFALKYTATHNSLVPVPEFCHKKSKSSARSVCCGILKSSRRSILGSVILASLLGSWSASSLASAVNGQYNYQLYRDFAENKGQFIPGVNQIKLYKKNNSTEKPDFIFSKPMPDFSSVSRLGYATLVAPSYIVSAKHNSGYKTVEFAETQYKLVARNEENLSGSTQIDLHVPRLNKFVVEATPLPLLPFDVYKQPNKITDGKRFPIATRLGTGTQYVRLLNDQKEYVTGGYAYLTGGTLDRFWIDRPIHRQLIASVTQAWQNALNTNTASGDSGSPLIIWDNETQQWEVAGVLYGSRKGSFVSGWTPIDVDFLQKILQKDIEPTVTLNGEQAAWNAGTIDSPDHSWQWTGINESRTNPDDGKHLVFSGGGEVTLKNNINQGAGGLFFDENQHYTFNGGALSWQGAGLDIGKGTVVDWNIAGVKNDFLHKIGKGRLNINEINNGGLRLGDGVVAVNTTAPAFSKIMLTSGRGRLIIHNSNSINPSELYFNARGGTLDLHGNDIAFRRIKALDNGATITNSSDKPAELTIAPVTDFSLKPIHWSPYDNHPVGTLYNVFNYTTGTVEYFIRKKPGNPYLPLNRVSTDVWEYLGNKRDATILVNSRRPKEHYIFHGNINGNVNVHSDTNRSNGDIAFDGNIDIPQGTLFHEGNILTFQGHPVIHAYNTKDIANRLKQLGDNSVKTQPVSFDQPDWQTRTFKLKQLRVEDAEFHLARNARLSGNIHAQHSLIILGSPDLYIDLKNGSNVFGVYKKGTSRATAAQDMSFYNGDVDLNYRSNLQIRQNFSGTISASDSTIDLLSPADQFSSSFIGLTNSTLNINSTGSGDISAANTIVTNTTAKNNITVAQLNASNSTVSLSPDNTQQHLTVDQLTANNSIFSFTVAPVSNQANQLTINSSAIGANNSISIHYSADNTTTDKPATNKLLTAASEQLLISSNKATPDEFFSLENPRNSNSYYSGLAVNTTDQRKNWWLISMTDNAGWQLHGNRNYSRLDLSQGGNVTLSAPVAEGWVPHRLSVGILNAMKVNFTLHARAHTGESDQIQILSQAIGDHNQLKVNFLLTSETPLFTKDLLLASAPADTPNSYFTINPISRGLTLFIPHGKIVNTDGEKHWLLSLEKPAVPVISTSTAALALRHASTSISSPPLVQPASSKTVSTSPGTSPMQPATPKTVSSSPMQPVSSETVSTPPAQPTTPKTVSPSPVQPVSSETTVSTSLVKPATPKTVSLSPVQPAIIAKQKPQPGAALFSQLSLKLTDLDQPMTVQHVAHILRDAGIQPDAEQIHQYQLVIAHTASVVKNVETLASLPNVAFVLETNQLNKRLGDVRQLGEDQGLWIKTSAGRASYQAMDLRHTTLQLGVDKKIDNHLFGIMGSYTRGSSQGATSSEKHTTAGAALYYSWVPDQGMFVDVIGKYLRNHQHFTFPTDAAIAEQFPRSSTLLGSVQLGYLVKFNSNSGIDNSNNLFIEPSIELLAGHTSGYRMNGRDFSIQVKNSNPLYSKIGVAAGYQWQFALQRAISVSASLYRLQNLHRGGAVELIGSGSNNRRLQQAAWDNRYLANFSVNARLSENWRIYSQLETSFGGQLKNDITGQIALRYQF